MLVWKLTFNFGAHEPVQSIFDAPILFLVFLHPLEYILLSLLLFEIGLAIEWFRFDIADAFGQRALQEDQVGWEVAVIAHFDNAADLQVRALKSLQLSCTAGSRLALKIILRLILLGPLAILIPVFNHRNGDDEGQRSECCHCLEDGRELRNQLDDDHHEEIGVSHLSELQEQVLGQECKARVLRSRHSICMQVRLFHLMIKQLIDVEHSSLNIRVTNRRLLHNSCPCISHNLRLKSIRLPLYLLSLRFLILYFRFFRQSCVWRIVPRIVSFFLKSLRLFFYILVVACAFVTIIVI